MKIRFSRIIFVTSTLNAALATRPPALEDKTTGAAALASGMNLIQRGTHVDHQADITPLAETTRVAELRREIAQLKAELAMTRKLTHRSKKSKRWFNYDLDNPDIENDTVYDDMFGGYTEEDAEEFVEEYNDIYNPEHMQESGITGRCGARIFQDMVKHDPGSSALTFGDAFVSFQDNCLYGPDAHSPQLCLEGTQVLFAGYNYSAPFDNDENSHFCKMLQNALLLHNFWQKGPNGQGPPQESSIIPPGGNGSNQVPVVPAGTGGGKGSTHLYQDALKKRIAERAARRAGMADEKLDAAMGSKPAN